MREHRSQPGWLDQVRDREPIQLPAIWSIRASTSALITDCPQRRGATSRVGFDATYIESMERQPEADSPSIWPAISTRPSATSRALRAPWRPWTGTWVRSAGIGPRVISTRSRSATRMAGLGPSGVEWGSLMPYNPNPDWSGAAHRRRLPTITAPSGTTSSRSMRSCRSASTTCSIDSRRRSCT